MRLILIFLMGFFLLSAHGATPSVAKYLDYLTRYPYTLGLNASYREGEIELIRDEQKINDIQALLNRKVGIIAEDQYWIWINDAVRFPNGTYGIYGRMVWKCSLEGMGGVAIMPVLPNGEIALNRNFRHATRSWEYELPRGCVLEHETLEQAALRELKEETGLIASHVELLGYLNPDSGMTNTVMPVYVAYVSKADSAAPEDSEAIASVDTFTMSELKQGFLHGFLCVAIADQLIQIHLRDPFLAFSLLQWDLRHCVK